MSVEAKRRQLRALLETAGSRYISVNFIKANGDDRQITINVKAAASHVQGAKTASTKQAVETRKINNPNLYNVWDNTKQEFRAINLDTVHRIVIDGILYKIGVAEEELVAGLVP